MQKSQSGERLNHAEIELLMQHAIELLKLIEHLTLQSINNAEQILADQYLKAA